MKSLLFVSHTCLFYLCCCLFGWTDAQDGLTGKEPLDPKGPDCIDKEQFELLKDSGQEIIGDECLPDADLPVEAFVSEYYSSLPAFGSSYGVMLAWLLTVYVNELKPEYLVTFQVQDHWTQEKINGTYTALVVLDDVKSENTKRFRASWWWKYTVTYRCYHGGNSVKTGRPIKDPERVADIKANFNEAVELTLEALEVLQYRAISQGILGFSVTDPRYSQDPFVPGSLANFPTMAPSIYPAILATGTYAVDINMREWDTRRYVGLAVFCWTVVFTTLTTILAARRQYHRHQKSSWGNLASTEGVENLLNVGYTVTGSKMVVYDKTNQGYRDDDSMLIGGFEQITHGMTSNSRTPSQVSSRHQKSSDTGETHDTHPSNS